MEEESLPHQETDLTTRLERKLAKDLEHAYYITESRNGKVILDELRLVLNSGATTYEMSSYIDVMTLTKLNNDGTTTEYQSSEYGIDRPIFVDSHEAIQGERGRFQALTDEEIDELYLDLLAAKVDFAATKEDYDHNISSFAYDRDNDVTEDVKVDFTWVKDLPKTPFVIPLPDRSHDFGHPLD